MNKEVLTYLLEEENMTEKMARQSLAKLERHADILEEFSAWVRTREYPKREAICVEGYTAQRLSETTHLHPVGSYNYLIYLRERPDDALRDLRDGLPKK